MLRSLFTDPVALHLGPLALRWYGLLIAVGAALGLSLAVREARHRRLNIDVLQDMVLTSGIGGLLGARMYYVLLNWESYRASPLEIVAVWHGGLAIHGALIGGIIGFLFVVKRKQIRNAWSYLDCLALGVLVGQIIGRWGNFINQEAFGTPTMLPWGMYIEPSHRPAAYAEFEFFHPTFLYESLWNLAVLGILIILNRRAVLRPGQTVVLYFIAYSFARFWIEFLRTDSLMIGSVRAAQVMSILLIAAGVVLFHRRGKPETG